MPMKRTSTTFMRPRRSPRAHLLLVAACVLMSGVLLAGTVYEAAAKPHQLAVRGKEPIDSRKGIFDQADFELIRRIQKGLAELGLYKGVVDGRMGYKTETAIRVYQRRSSLKADGLVSESLAQHMENGFKVDQLLGRLQDSRDEKTTAARAALMSRPETRDLLKNRKDEIADPTRDATGCLNSPTAQCLLTEAVESAKAIFKEELRDWALGEILVSQAKAGLGTEAMKTVRRISDPRLVMVALRDIAKAQASAGQNEEALIAADIIPDPIKQIEALSMIASIQAKRGDGDGTAKTIQRLLAVLQKVDSNLKKIVFHAKIAVIMSQAGNEKAAKSNLDTAETLSRSGTAAADKNAALRHIATAFAEMEMPGRALDVLKELDNQSDRTPVLVTTATSQARSGNPDQALETAKSIKATRFLAVVLSRIAVAQAKLGDNAAARETLDHALSLGKDIKLPYARAFAASRIALALSKIGSSTGTITFDQAVEATEEISDDSLRAHVLWTITADRKRAGDEAGVLATEKLALAATKDIKSTLSRVWMFGDIALNHAAADEPDDAWRAFNNGMAEAKEIHNAWGRSRALSKMASTLTALMGNEKTKAIAK